MVVLFEDEEYEFIRYDGICNVKPDEIFMSNNGNLRYYDCSIHNGSVTRAVFKRVVRNI